MEDKALAELVELRGRLMKEFKHHWIETGIRNPREVRGIPAGTRFKIRIRYNAAPRIFIKTQTAICECLLILRDGDEHWTPMLQQTLNIRGQS